MRGRLKLVVDGDETPFVEGEAGLAKPFGGRCARHPDRLVDRDRAAGVGKAGLVEALGFEAGHYVDVALFEDLSKRLADLLVVRRQDLIIARGDGKAARAASWSGAGRAGERVLHRKEQLDTTGAGADHADAQVGIFEDALLQRLPGGEESRHRLDRDGLANQFEVRIDDGRRANVDGDDVVGYGGATVGTGDQAAVGIDTGDAGRDQARAGEARQGTEIDVGLLEGVVAGDHSRQHAGIRGVHLRRDQRHPGALDRKHAE